jgi:hypothetical protein
MSLAKWWTRKTVLAPEPRPRKCSNLRRFFLIHNMKRMAPKKSSLLAKYQASTGHLIELSIAGKMNLARWWTTPTPVRSELTPRKCSNLFRLFLIHNMKRMTTKNSSISAKYQASYGHLIELSIVRKMNWIKWWTTPAPVTSQPRPRKCSNLFRFILVHNLKRITPKKSSLLAKY